MARRTWISLLALVVLAAASACDRTPAWDRAASDNSDGTPAEIATLDSLLTELGGVPAEQLMRGQRWRMISSIGAGLPPSGFEVAHLPEPDARGAQLLEAYCVQCHWIPAPQMHAADEWPLLMRRMEMRTRSLRRHLGGPLTEGLLGEILVSGMASAEFPSPADADSMLAYLQRHSLTPARQGELEPGPGSEAFARACSLCHELPSPAMHTASEWPAVVARMQGNMLAMGVEQMSPAETAAITEYLARH